MIAILLILILIVSVSYNLIWIGIHGGENIARQNFLWPGRLGVSRFLLGNLLLSSILLGVLSCYLFLLKGESEEFSAPLDTPE